MGQGAIDASDAGSARGRVQDGDQTVILPRVDADQARGEDARAQELRAQELMAQEVLAQELLARELQTDAPWPDDDAAMAPGRSATELAAALATGLATFPYLGRTIRRRAKVWCSLGAVGLILGLGLHVAKPPPYKAMTLIHIANGPASNPIDEINTEISLVQSRTVASLAEKQLGLTKTENVNKFLASYTPTEVTDEIISVTASAPSAQDAVSHARAVAQAYLKFQADQLQAQQRGVTQQLDGQITGYVRQVDTDEAAVAKASAPGATSSEQASLNQRKDQLRQDESTLSQLRQAQQAYVLNNQQANDQVVAGSYVLDTAGLLPASKVKSPAAYALGGLVAGLLAGIGIVIIAALVSDKLRRRDDIARALAAPVELSVGRIRTRRRPGRRGLAAARDRRVQRVVAYLDGLLPVRTSRRAPALVVVPLDARGTGALAVAALALSRAQLDQQVVVADLIDGAPAARLLGVREHGTHVVDVAGQKLTVIVPEGLGPAGPLGRPGAQEPSTRAGVHPDIAAAYRGADLLLTLAAADPALSADYLCTWGSGSVVLVTAGESSASQLHATADMIRLAGLRIMSAVVLGADKTDDSIGAWAPTGPEAEGERLEGSRVAPIDAILSAVVRGDRSS